MAALAVRARRRARKRALRPTALAAPMLLLGLVLVWHGRTAEERLPKDPTTPVHSNATGTTQDRPRVPAADTTKPAPIQFINDEELSALFPARAMALVGPPGAQQLVFLGDKPGPTDGKSPGN